MVNGQTDAKFFAISTACVAHSLGITRTHRHYFSYKLNTVAHKWGIKFDSSTHAIQFGSLF